MHIYSAETATVEIPDMEKIENAVRDSRSPYYYPDLMKKYLGNDTTMTLQDFRHLYLGYASQERPQAQERPEKPERPVKEPNKEKPKPQTNNEKPVQE